MAFRTASSSPARLTRAGVALAAASTLLLAACGSGGDDKDAKGDGLNPGDYTIASGEGVSNSVVVNGTIAPARAVNITTMVQSEVKKVAVKPGDRVTAEQFLAAMDTAQLERQLEVQQKQQANAQADAMANVELAQKQLDAYQAGIDNGTNPGIRSAQAQVNQAQAAYNAAVAGGARLFERGVAAVEHVAGGVSSHGSSGGESQVPGVPGVAPSAAPGVPGAPAQPGQDASQEELAQVLGGDGGAGAAANSAMSPDEAYAALQAAQAELASAQTQAAQERDQLQAQVDSAWRQAQAAQLGDGDGTLEYQVQESTVYAPMAGLVTSVDVQEGDIPQGKLMTIADDSRLIIRAEVREADVPNVAAGNRVEFTSTATGKKKFSGRVTRVAPAAEAPTGGQVAQLGAGGSGEKGKSDVTFPVEIEVTGDKEGLLLGGSARAEIITAESKGALSVPLDAVMDNNGEKKVYVLATDGDDATTGKVEERAVKTGAENDVDVAVTGGDLKPGDIVINWPDEYKDRVGDEVKITDPGFNADKVREARETKQRTTATVTVTSTRRAAEGQ